MDGIKPRIALSEFWGPNRLVFGRDAVAGLPEIVDGFAARRIRIIRDGHVSSAALGAAVDELRRGHDVIIDEHDGREPVLEEAVACALFGAPAELIVAVGGGSTIDTAKAVALAQTAGAAIERYEGANRVEVQPIPLIAVPTTAGTGSEVTGSCVLTARAGDRKISIRSPKLRPAVAVLDPRFLASVPKEVIRATGVDALAHAIEAYFSISGSLLTDELALGAMRLLSAALPLYYTDPTNERAAQDMAWGACIAGIAFNSARVGLAHAVASAIGPLTGLSHGLSVGLALPAAVRTNFRSRNAEGAELMAAFGIALPQGDAQCAFLDRLASIYRSVEFPATARELGRHFDVDDALITRIVNSGRLDTNPVPLSASALRDELMSISG